MLPALLGHCRIMAWPVAVAALVVAGSGTALAQPPAQLQDKASLEGPFLKNRAAIQQYINGEKQPTGASDSEAKEAATAAARWFVIRLTFFTTAANDHEYFLKCLHEFDRDFMGPALKYAAQNKAFMAILNQQMVATLKELLATDFKAYNSSQINGCLLLTSLAKYGDDACGDYLVELLKDAKVHDALRVHVLKGLRMFFAARPLYLPPVLDVDDQRVRESDAARAGAVLAFLTRQGPSSMSPEETDAYRFIRREAIKALAQTRIPAESIDKNGVKTAIALGLMKVLAAEKNGVNPPPSLTEKAEAAIGLCRMTNKLEKYQPDAAIYLVGKFLIEFAAKYREDAPNLKGGDRPPMLPWKYYAYRLEDALQQMSANAKDAAYSTKVKTLWDNSKRNILDRMKNHVTIDDPTLLVGAVAAMWPKAPALTPYQGVSGAQIQLPAPPQGQ